MSHYTGLNALMTQFVGQPFDVLGYPCNLFGGQEPGDNSELLNGLKYVRPGSGFVPLFPLTQKVNVNGLLQDSVWTFLKAACPAPSPSWDPPIPWSPVTATDVAWNFEAVLLNKQGIPYRRYATPVDPRLTAPDVAALLAA